MMFLGFAKCVHCGRENVGVTLLAPEAHPRMKAHSNPANYLECIGSRQIIYFSEIRSK